MWNVRDNVIVQELQLDQPVMNICLSQDEGSFFCSQSNNIVQYGIDWSYNIGGVIYAPAEEYDASHRNTTCSTQASSSYGH